MQFGKFDGQNFYCAGFFISIVVFFGSGGGVSLSMLMVFLISALPCAYNMLKVIESVVTVMT